MFERIPTKILYAYKVWQNVYDEMERCLTNIDFTEGLPSKYELIELSKQGEHSLLILDDLLLEASENIDIINLFTVYVHHLKLTTLCITQNLFGRGKYMRSISLNTHYFILFKNMRDKQQISTFARQIFPGKVKYFMDAYEKAISKPGDGRVVRWCWVNFQCRGVLLSWIRVGQGPTALAVGAGGVVWTFFLSSIISLFLLPLSGRRSDID